MLELILTSTVFVRINIYVDSPLAVNATNIMRTYLKLLNKNIQRFTLNSPDLFGSDKLLYYKCGRFQSFICQRGTLCYYSASGMAEAGRGNIIFENNIKTTEIQFLCEVHGAPVFSGRLCHGDKEVEYLKKNIKVKAVKIIESLSAHTDYEEMILSGSRKS